MVTVTTILSELRLLAESGALKNMVFEPGLTPSEHHELLRVHRHLPHDLLQILDISNGLAMFGLEIMAGRQMYQCSRELLVFQNWGNGDLDCVVIDISHPAYGSVVFTNHTPKVAVPVARSVAEWLEKVAGEGKRRGRVLHPRDIMRTTEVGVYSVVLQALRGVDCELNR